MTTTARSLKSSLIPLGTDLLCVLAFALGGKDTHDSGESAWVVLAIAWPFALAATLAHVALVRRGSPARQVWPEGVLVLTATYALGMTLRAVSGRGLAVGFLIVAAVFLAVTMLGWRAVAFVADGRRNPR